ncbi:AMP-binding protein, partial [Acinetobacter baumannii]
MTHRNMCAALDSLNTYLGYQESDHILCSLPLSFDYGLYQMIMSMSKGATLFLEQELTWPLFLIKKIKQHKITVIPFVPTMLSL